MKKGLSGARHALMQQFSSGFDLVQKFDGDDDNEMSLSEWRAVMRSVAHSLISPFLAVGVGW